MLASGRREHGLFLTASVARGESGIRLLTREVVAASEVPFDRQGRHSLGPSAAQLSAAVGAAEKRSDSLVFIHSHPDPWHPPRLSVLDEETTHGWAQTLVPMLGTPMVSLVWTPGGVAGICIDTDDLASSRPVDVEVLGDRRRVLLSHGFDFIADDALDDRQVRALSALGNSVLRSLHVGLVGLGGTGSPLAEQLARMGVCRLTLVDHDCVDDASNLRRISGARAADLATSRFKVDVVGDHLESLGLGVIVQRFPHDVRDGVAVRALLDVDLIISTTDTHSSRALLNQLALQYFVPTIDVGCIIGTSDAGVTGMPVEVRVLLPDTACLWCRQVLDAARIRTENLPEAERAEQIREGYVQNIDAHAPSVAALNGLAASAASLTMLRLHTEDGVVADSMILDAWELYTHTGEPAIDPDCICASWRGAADMARLPTRS